ncbi:uncharacterized protein [Aristolochia californica]|uniref:uncharacterized protein n=1 Tax=Aristolochia californica TaxID=171875 RepID=UPI0035D9A379
MTWILGSLEPHLVPNLRPYKTAANMWHYLHKIYRQTSTARRFQVEYELANFTQGSCSIEEYFSGFQNLWADYTDIVYEDVPAAAVSAVQTVHDTSKRDQFLMKLRPEFEIARSHLMNRHPLLSLDACLSELLWEEQHLTTQAGMEPRVQADLSAPVAYVAQGRPQGRDTSSVQCFHCKAYGHFVRDCPKKSVLFCSYCKKPGHHITVYPTRPPRRKPTAYHASTGTSSSATLPPAVSVPIIPVPPAPASSTTLTPEMVQQMIISAFSTFGISVTLPSTSLSSLPSFDESQPTTSLPSPPSDLAFAPDPPSTPAHLHLRRSTRSSHPPDQYGFPSPVSLVATLSSISIPSGYKQAIVQECWQKAIQTELQALEENHTWDIVADPPTIRPLGRRRLYEASLGYVYILS